MPNMEIKRETLPNRCEVCHQIDLFDINKGYCSRCDKYSGFDKQLTNDLNNVEVNVKVEFQDIIKSSFWYSYRYNELIFGYSISSVFLLVIFSLILLLSKNISITSCIILLILAFPIFNVPYLYLSTYKRFSKLQDHEKMITFTFNTQGYGLTTKKVKVFLQWDLIIKAIEAKNYFYVFFNEKSFSVIPKRFLVSDNDALNIRKLLQTHIGQRFDID